MRLLSLPPDLLKLLEGGGLSSGHARALLSLPPGQTNEVAQRVWKEGLSVRQTEALVKRLQCGKGPEPSPLKTPTFYREMELALGQALSRKVRISATGKERGQITIEFYSSDELKELGRRLTPDE